MYMISNGCKEGLVDSPLDCPGVSSAPTLYRGETALEGCSAKSPVLTPTYSGLRIAGWRAIAAQAARIHGG